MPCASGPSHCETTALSQTQWGVPDRKKYDNSWSVGGAVSPVLALTLGQRYLNKFFQVWASRMQNFGTRCFMLCHSMLSQNTITLTSGREPG